jgi:hypothetical protein
MPSIRSDIYALEMLQWRFARPAVLDHPFGKLFYRLQIEIERLSGYSFTVVSEF